MQQHRALILRSNRFLGFSLVDEGLVSSGDLEEYEVDHNIPFEPKSAKKKAEAKSAE